MEARKAARDVEKGITVEQRAEFDAQAKKRAEAYTAGIKAAFVPAGTPKTK